MRFHYYLHKAEKFLGQENIKTTIEFGPNNWVTLHALSGSHCL